VICPPPLVLELALACIPYFSEMQELWRLKNDRCAQLFGIGAEASVVFLPPSSLATRVGEGEYRRDHRARLVHSLETRG
jgi:hypothetical protein